MSQENKTNYQVGDFVTLCQTEFDSNEFDGIYRIQVINGNVCLVTSIDEYVEIDPLNPPSTITVMREHVELVELRHATEKEKESGSREWT